MTIKGLENLSLTSSATLAQVEEHQTGMVGVPSSILNGGNF